MRVDAHGASGASGAHGASGASTMFSGIRAAGRKSEANVGLVDIHAMVRY